MDNFMNTAMLVCAVIAALAAGVLLGYVTCKGLFALCSMHVKSLGAARGAAKTAEPHTVSA